MIGTIHSFQELESARLFRFADQPKDVSANVKLNSREFVADLGNGTLYTMNERLDKPVVPLGVLDDEKFKAVKDTWR